ncbi:class v aminotransferase [Ophiostoma piceae UAMH 11346]|uniref:Class v aminotransferase n=1 Tax=Ophiostoma piceae (strain UAMH 11346) TaxID=1262450 RepID=S3CS65_OPHP1|nr:class v aminotransferase [Ophiostoma piceae UAMH 11346]
MPSTTTAATVEALATSDTFELFSDTESASYRSLVPALASDAVTHVNSGYQSLMNLTIKKALDVYLDQAASHPAPKAIWTQQAADAKAALAAHVHVPDDSLVYTRDTTEGLNLFQRSLHIKPGDNIVVLAGEHPNHAYGWLALRDETGLEVRVVPDDTVIAADADTFAPYVDDRTLCIGLSSVMFHSGQLNDVRSVSDRFRSRGIHVLVDLTQHIGLSDIDLTSLNVSAAAFGAHKGLACPTGLGALYIQPGVLASLKPTPPIVGAGAVANLRGDLVAQGDVQYHSTAQRYAHFNMCLMSAVALGASLRLLEDIGMSRIESHVRALGCELIKRLDTLSISVVGSRNAHQRSPHIYIVPLLHADWASHFQESQVYVTHYRRGVRVSFGFYNSVQDVTSFVGAVEKGLAKGIPTK